MWRAEIAAIPDRHRLQPLEREVKRDEVADVRLVLDDEDAGP